MFKENSRYAKLPVKTYVAEDGTEQSYVSRRLLPQPETLTTSGFDVVQPQDRLDQITARAYGDPTQYWRIVDATLESEPSKLTDDVGRRLRIPMVLPE